MQAGTERTIFEKLDDCHRQISARLSILETVARRAQARELNDDLRRQAGAVEFFFSHVSRDHHEQEERTVFPPLLAIGAPVLVETVRSLQAEHAWIEDNWTAMAASLREIASGRDAFDPGRFLAEVQAYVEVLRAHIELEDTVIYPQSRTHWTRAMAAGSGGAPSCPP